MDIAKKEKDKHLGLRIDTELHYKLHYISQYEGRSANGEVIYLIRKAVSGLKPEDATERILDLFVKTKCNRDFLIMARKIRWQ